MLNGSTPGPTSFSKIVKILFSECSIQFYFDIMIKTEGLEIRHNFSTTELSPLNGRFRERRSDLILGTLHNDSLCGQPKVFETFVTSLFEILSKLRSKSCRLLKGREGYFVNFSFIYQLIPSLTIPPG